MICFSCPECGFDLEFGDAASGSWVRCPECRAKIAVPELGALPTAEAERIVREVAERHGAKATLRRLGHFPPEVVANAAATFAHGLREGEVPLALIDTSLMQNGKAGLLATNRCLYSSTYPDPIPLEDIQDVRYAGLTAADYLRPWVVLAIAIALSFVIGLAQRAPSVEESGSLTAVALALVVLECVLGYRILTRRPELLVNQAVVYAGGKRSRPAYWQEMLETLGKAAREAQERGDVPRPQRDLTTRVRRAPGAGPTPRFITCERCGLEYVSRAVPGTPPRAEGEADPLDSNRARAWYERLRAAPHLVPCPGCGWCQRDMVVRARRARHRWMVRTGLLLVPAAVVLFLVAYINNMEHDINPAHVSPSAVFLGWFCFGIPAVLAPGLLLLRFVLNPRGDPNRAPAEVRRELGRERTVPLEPSELAAGTKLPEAEEPEVVRPTPEASAGHPSDPRPLQPPEAIRKPPAGEGRPAEA